MMAIFVYSVIYHRTSHNLMKNIRHLVWLDQTNPYYLFTDGCTYNIERVIHVSFTPQ